MKNTEQERFKDMKEVKKRVAELMQTDKMFVEVVQHEKSVYIWENEKDVIIQLMGFLYTKTLLKNNRYRISYKYNYIDKQIIKVTNDYTNYDGSITKTTYIFYNVPTCMGYLETTDLYNRIK